MSDDERFDRALEELLADRSPLREATGLSKDEQRMVHMAQLLRGTRTADATPEFAERLRRRVFGGSPRVSRRTAFLSGISALAAGVLAGVGIDRLAERPGSGPSKLVAANGKWFPVATLADVPEGTVRPFSAGAVQGFVVNRAGSLYAISRICTHMGCALRFERDDQALVCPCHGAEFGLNGRPHYAPAGYAQALPRLPSIDLRVRGEIIEAWGA